MNAIVGFRKCTLNDEQLLEKVDKLTDKMYDPKLGGVPTRHIPAQPNNDYDLLVGELLLRFKEKNIKNLENLVKNQKTVKISYDKDDGFFIEIPHRPGTIMETFYVADNNLDNIHQSIFKAVEAANEYLEYLIKRK